jgi:glycosyltransferase involved in cell wall biosynthesis
MKVALFGTHPNQYNGYSKVVYELASELAKMPDVKLFVFGFQNMYPRDQIRPRLPDNVMVYDPMADEGSASVSSTSTISMNRGFGTHLVKTFVALCQPDVAIVYNDMAVISAVVRELKDVPDRRFKIVTYIDQVYLNQKRYYIEFVNAHSDAAILFTPGWERCIVDQGVHVPTYNLPHGINTSVYFPIPRNLARRYYGFRDEEFLILNLNRNQPRKRWDTCMKAMAELVRRRPEAPIKLIVATAIKGAWDLLELYDRELRKRGVDIEVGRKHVVFVDSPQRMTDREVNMLLNTCDVGINTCDGEGFGLCNFEHAAVGKPQVVTRLGAFPDIFDDQCAALIQPTVAFYLDSTRDSVGGEALMCNYEDFADALEEYYVDPKKREIHGQRARARIMELYRWPAIAEKLRGILLGIVREDRHAPLEKEMSVHSMENVRMFLEEERGLVDAQTNHPVTETEQQTPPNGKPKDGDIQKDEFTFDISRSSHSSSDTTKESPGAPPPSQSVNPDANSNSGMVESTDPTLAALMRQMADMQRSLQDLFASKEKTQ